MSQCICVKRHLRVRLTHLHRLQSASIFIGKCFRRAGLNLGFLQLLVRLDKIKLSLILGCEPSDSV